MVYILEAMMRTVVKGSLVTLALLLGGWQARAGLREDAGGKEAKAAQTKALCAEKCARCHGADGRGRTVLGEMLSAPDFTDEKFWDGAKGDGRLVNSIIEGKGEMPAFGKKLSKREIGGLAEYVRGFRKPAS